MRNSARLAVRALRQRRPGSRRRERGEVGPGTRLAVLTHQVRVMDRRLARTGHLWRLRSKTRVFHKGHHPRTYVLTRRG